MIIKFHNFKNTYNIQLNIVNDIIYLYLYNHIYNNKYNLIFSSIELQKTGINNISLLYSCLLKCFNNVENYKINILESTNTAILVIDINESFTINNNFELILYQFNDYYERLLSIINKDISDNSYNSDADIDTTTDYDNYKKLKKYDHKNIHTIIKSNNKNNNNRNMKNKIIKNKVIKKSISENYCNVKSFLTNVFMIDNF